MSWNTLLTFVEHLGPDKVLALLPEHTRLDATGFEDATSAQLAGVALTHAAGWTVLCSPLDEPFPDEVFLTRASAGGRVLLLTLGGVGDVYGFSVFAGGEHLREQVYAAGELAEEAGEPLPQEAPRGDDAEAWLFAFMTRFTGLTLADLAALEYQVVQTPQVELSRAEHD